MEPEETATAVTAYEAPADDEAVPQEGSPEPTLADDETPQEDRLPFYYRGWFLVLAFLVFWPAAILLLWRRPDVDRGTKKAVIGLAFLAFLVSAFLMSGPGDMLAAARAVSDAPGGIPRAAASIPALLLGGISREPAAVSPDGTVVEGNVDSWSLSKDGKSVFIDLDMQGNGHTPQTYAAGSAASYSVGGVSVKARSIDAILRASAGTGIRARLTGLRKDGTFAAADFTIEP